MTKQEVRYNLVKEDFKEASFHAVISYLLFDSVNTL